MTRRALFASIGLGVGSFALGFANAGLWFLCAVSLIFGVIWFYAQWRSFNWFSMAGLVLAVMIGASGIWFGVNTGWMFAGVLFSLFAWDLIEFQERLKLVFVKSDAPALEARHLSRLGMLGAGALLVFLMTIVLDQLRINVCGVNLLVLVFVFGLARLTWRLRLI